LSEIYFRGVRVVEDPHNQFLWGSGPPDPHRIGAYAKEAADPKVELVDEVGRDYGICLSVTPAAVSLSPFISA